MKKFIINYYSVGLLGLIVLLALTIRLVSLPDIPPGLNRDEASIGYTAYSLLKTGKDEYGKSWPLSFKSFGDWKVPVYFYLDIPFIALGGLSETSTRLPSALLGTLTVGLIYFLVKLILHHETEANGKKLSLPNLHIELIALLSALMFAISPWSVFMSRNASESNVAVFFVTLSLVLFFWGFKKRLLFIPAFGFLVLSMFTYHGNHIFTPLLFTVICLFFGRELFHDRYFRIGISIFILLAAIIYSQTLFGADKTKISGLFPLGDEAMIYKEIVMRRLEYSNPTILIKLLHNKPVYLVKTIIINYIRSLSPEFLFIRGGGNPQHNIPDFGNLYLWEALVWPIAFFIFFSKFKNTKFIWFLILWFLISPVAGSITKDAPHTNRMMGLLPLPAILTGFGLFYLFLFLTNSKLKLLIPVISGLIIVYFIIYLDQYFYHFPYTDADKWGSVFHSMVTKVNRLQDKYSQIIISRPDVSPYIYFLFYNKTDPTIFQKEVVRYTETAEGFQHVKSFRNLAFQKIDWTDELLVPDKLYVDWAESIPSGATDSAIIITKNEQKILKNNYPEMSLPPLGSVITSRIVDQIDLPNKQPFIYMIETRLSATPSAAIYAHQ